MAHIDQTSEDDTDFYDLDSWVEISSQPSSSSLSSIGDDIITTGPRVQHDSKPRRRRTLRHNTTSDLNIHHRPSRGGDASSQEEYDESESEEDKVMTSSGEGPILPSLHNSRAATSPAAQVPAVEEPARQSSDDDDENRTAINFSINNDQCFTPQPNAFSHPPSGQLRSASHHVPGSYFPSQRRDSRPATRNSHSTPQSTIRSGHTPQNILSPSYDAAAQHEEALRTSLSTLLSCAAAARGLPKAESKQTTTTYTQPRGNRIEPMSLRLVPESALPTNSPPQLQEPTFKPTIRRQSTSTSTSSEHVKENKRKAAGGRSSSRERRALKKARRSPSNEDLSVSPTLLTWVVSAGVVVVLSALSFSAGYSLGKEAGRMEAGSFATDEQIRSCAREAGRSSLGLKRTLARSAVQV